MDTWKKECGLSDDPYAFKDLVDIERLRETFEHFSQLTGFTTGLVSYPEQELLIGTGWRDICMKFHRACPSSEVHCKQSNLDLTSKLERLEELSIRPCKNGLVDGATPIIVEGMHLANLFTGQILLKKPNIDRFRKQAEDYGYDLKSYLKALNEVPVVNEDKFRNVMLFLCDMAVMLAETGLRELRLQQMERKRKQAEKALKESELKYRLMADNVTDVIWVLDKDLKYTYISPSVRKLRGYEPDEAIQIPFDQVFTPTSYQKAIKIFSEVIGWDSKQEVVSDKSMVLELDVIRKDGVVIPVEVNTSLLRDENGLSAGIIGITRDITDRKRTEKELQKSEEKFRSIFENKGTATVLYGEDRIIRECNAMFEELTGYSKFEIIEKKKWSDFVVNEDMERMKTYHNQRLTKGESPPSQYECGIINRNGDVRTVIINLNLIGDNRIVTLTDISPRKKAEKEQKKLQEQLIQAQKMEAVGTLAGGIAHDFNNILSGIFGYSQLAEMHIDNREKAKIDIRNIVKIASRATQLVQQILTFSRKTDYEKQYFNLFVVVKEVLTLIRSTIPTTIEIKEKINSKASIFADPIQMHQILMNLCTNAYHAMSDSGGELTVKLDETYIPDPNKVSILNKGQKYIELEISDTGHGMDKHTVEKIFDPYFTTKTREKGTGLGLAMVRAIVMDHGGSISVNSTVGRGSTFLIYLPIIEQKSNTSIKRILDKKTPTGTESILFVEDEENIRFSIQEFLEGHGYKLTVSENGKKAYEEFKRAPQDFDIVITDMAMPKMNGDELALKILKIRNDIPVILCTGYSEKLNEEQSKEIGIARYIHKPIAGKELCFLIREVLDEKKSN